jgi:hypothetical protein
MARRLRPLRADDEESAFLCSASLCGPFDTEPGS